MVMLRSRQPDQSASEPVKLDFLRGTRGLLVEDTLTELDNLRIATKLMQVDHVEGADSKHQAIAMLEAGYQPQWILLDFRLGPDAWGHEVAIWIATHMLPRPVVLSYSGEQTGTIVSAIALAGWDTPQLYEDMLQKPFPLFMLMHRIAQLLQDRLDQ